MDTYSLCTLSLIPYTLPIIYIVGSSNGLRPLNKRKGEGSMTPERQAKLKALRERLANLTDEEKQALTNRGIIATIEGRQLSLHNTFMVYLQCNGNSPSVVGGFKQWRKAGRTVKRGEHGYTIMFPVGTKDEETGEITEATSFYTATVFDISQTELLDQERPETKPEPQPEPKPEQAAAQGRLMDEQNQVKRPEPAPATSGQEDYMKGWQLV
jgi:hypothetical protein